MRSGLIAKLHACVRLRSKEPVRGSEAAGRTNPIESSSAREGRNKSGPGSVNGDRIKRRR